MSNGLLLNILTPGRTILAAERVDIVSLPAYHGEVGILPGHAPIVLQLKEGILRYRVGMRGEIFAILGGFAEIYRDKVTVLAEAAELAEEINEERARQSEMQAKEKLIGRAKDKDMDLEEATAALRRAGARLKAARLKKDRHHVQEATSPLVDE